ncbi:hypothetical protein QAD02_000195 [Eretmocerus hayati]|uniref:Uncharacterized protein n=1 Tax=Eretmocerus hayati TaxID=131215 RepID=A0ACC2NEB8_9HYME|nr:hypothetical protein QAD02_000195 [Eretmocerus hayati]
MWPFSDIFVINVVGNFLGMFIRSHYGNDLLIQNNVRIIEEKVMVKSFEFSQEAIEAANSLAEGRFPESFLFGAATSAYQTEGASNVSDKGESVWDFWTHHARNFVDDGSNADVASNSFHKYPEDIHLVKSLGANTYGISLSWSRILPDGLANFVSLDGVRHYNDVINAIVLSGLTPIVTMHHFDIPHKLQVMGGWTNPKMVEYFENFAKVAFTYFGDRVKYWITINDPWSLCNEQFGSPFRPIYNDTGIGNYICGHHALLAHARAYRMYRNEFQWLQKGKVGISLSTRWFEPDEYTSPDDAEATEISFHFSNNWFLHPILSENGGYPELMQTKLGIKSAQQHFKRSRLPNFTPEEVGHVKSSLDFLGLSFFTTFNARYFSLDTSIAYSFESVSRNESLEGDMSATWLPYNDAYGAFEIKNTAANFRKLLTRLNNDYFLPQIYITANGYPDYGEMYDLDRTVYLYEHINELLNAMRAGIDVRGYMAWSLIDGFEWKDGYRKRYGLFGVDFNNETRPREEKLSAKVIRSIYNSREIPDFFTSIEP